MTRGFALWAGLAALAAVVVAGVTISVFPQEPRTELPPVITVPVQPALFGPVPVSFLSGVIGKTTHAALIRGGAATRTSTSRDIGRVAVKISSMPPAEPQRL
jgi:hypothetical protein